jgi:hypothetical protein
MMHLLSAYALGRFCWRLYLLALATFPEGNPCAEVRRKRAGAFSLLREKGLDGHCCKCSVFEAVKSNRHLLRFTSRNRAEAADLQGGA